MQPEQGVVWKEITAKEADVLYSLGVQLQIRTCNADWRVFEGHGFSPAQLYLFDFRVQVEGGDVL